MYNRHQDTVTKGQTLLKITRQTSQGSFTDNGWFFNIGYNFFGFICASPVCLRLGELQTITR